MLNCGSETPSIDELPNDDMPSPSKVIKLTKIVKAPLFTRLCVHLRKNGTGQKTSPRKHLFPPPISDNTESSSTSSSTAPLIPPPVIVAPSPWQDNPNVPPDVPNFSGCRKVRLENKNLTPLDAVQLFLGDQFFNDIARNTNLYADQQNVKKRKNMADWKRVDAAETKKFFSLLFAMGLVQKSKISEYWSTNPVLSSSFHKSVMSRNRFWDILTNLRIVCDPLQSTQYDPLGKIRPFIDHLTVRFTTLFSPGKQLSLDEATCAFKGQVFFRCYNPRKPNKYGFKIYQVCDSMTGYCCSFKISTGESNTTYDIVFELMRDHLDKGHEVYMDRYYSSVKLYNDLYLRKTVAVGTCMVNRKGLPKEFLAQSIPQETLVACRQGPLLALKWRDKRDVVVLSTKHIANMKEVQTKRSPFVKNKPVAILDYNTHMCGVDNSDQMLSYYSFNRKTIDWWKKLFFHLINLALVNAQKIYNVVNLQPMPLSAFLLSVIEDLVDDAGASQEREDLVSHPNPFSRVFRNYRHFPVYNKGNASKSHAQRDCVVCAMKRKHKTIEEQKKFRKTTVYQCKICKVPLCIVDCFEVYHTQEKFWQ